MSDAMKKGGGEADGARLLRLARRELLDNVLPALDGDDERYRARLIANAMKIAAQELEGGAAASEETARDFSAFVQATLGEAPVGPQATAVALRDALRSGQLDASPALYDLLQGLSRRRREQLG